jgi:hypothetical protein
MQTITTIGLDIAKSVFQVHGVDADGNLVLRRPRCRCQGRRHQRLQFSQVPPPIANPVDSGRRCNRRPHPATHVGAPIRHFHLLAHSESGPIQRADYGRRIPSAPFGVGIFARSTEQLGAL